MMEESQRKKKVEERLAFLSRYQQLYPDSAEWARLQYLIQMSLSNVSVQLKRVYMIGNTGLESKFITNNLNKNSLDLIITENDIKNGEQQFNEICDKGFKKPLTVAYGHLDLENFPKDSDDYYQAFMCRVAIGKTYIFPNKNSTGVVPHKEKPESMSKQFDSLFIYDEPTISREFKQQYVIYDSSTKCLPIYIMHFSLDQNRYKQLKEKVICQLCQDNVARKYCETQSSYLCIECDNEHHRDRLAYKHKRTEIAEKPKILGECSNHPTLKLQLFCMQCNRPICINCKIKGDHSTGENLTHLLVRITERYEETRRVLRETDSGLQKKKKSLINSIELVENKLKDINKKSIQIQEKIYEITQTALKELQTITKKKMSFLMSDHIELKRQLDHIQWAQKFIKYQFDVLSPNDLLLAWSRHLNLRRQIISNQFTVSNIVPDMRVEGYMKILTEEQARTRKGVSDTNDNIDISKIGKSQIFRQGQQKNQNTLRMKVPVQSQVKDTGQPIIIKSHNNFLNLSILKHL